MTRPIKLLTIGLWVLAGLGLFSVIALQIIARNREQARLDQDRISINTTDVQIAGRTLSELPVDQHPRPQGINVPDFALVDQLNRPISNADLLGQVWIADFVFTQCASVCPQMSHRLAELQKDLPPQVKLVSFSVDPDNDTPATLLTYARGYGADNDRWHFLTGDKKKVYAAVAAMKIGIRPASDANPLEHDSHFLVIDRQGRVCGLYDSSSPEDVTRLARDAIELTHAVPASGSAGR